MWEVYTTRQHTSRACTDTDGEISPSSHHGAPQIFSSYAQVLVLPPILTLVLVLILLATYLLTTYLLLILVLTYYCYYLLNTITTTNSNSTSSRLLHPWAACPGPGAHAHNCTTRTARLEGSS